MQSHRPLGRHLVVGISSMTLTTEEKRFLHETRPSGVILFSRNIQGPNQVQALILAVHEQVSPSCTLWIDQEGGRVQRLREPFTHFPSPWRLAELAQQTSGTKNKAEAERATVLARLAGQVCGIELATLGIGINCAPVLDIRETGRGADADPVIGERAFGDTPQGVVQLAGAWLEGFQQWPVMAVGKHFPGHGAATVDSHKSLPTLSKSRAALERWELQPFKQLITRLPALMTAHLVAPGLGENEPATWSPLILQKLLRQAWGYQGLIVSDALEMGALSGSMEERAYRSIHAGCDLVLCCTGRLEDNASALAGVRRALETMTTTQREQLDKRVATALAPYCPPPGDWQGLLRHPDYLRARHFLESLAESGQDQEKDPTETTSVP